LLIAGGHSSEEHSRKANSVAHIAGTHKGNNTMTESSVSSKFQTDLRKAVPGCEVIKHADKSMIGMVDASLTYNKQTIWMEYKLITPATKGVVWRDFLHKGIWEPYDVAMASPTQYATACRLATAGHCCYLFWVMDHEAIRKKIARIVLWHPITGKQQVFENNQLLVAWWCDYLCGHHSLEQ